MIIHKTNTPHAPVNYQIIGYDKDNDVEVLLASHPDYKTAKLEADTFWRPLARKETVRNLHGAMSMQEGEPLDWIILRHDGDTDEIISLF